MQQFDASPSLRPLLTPCAASLSSAWLDQLFAGGQSAVLPMGQPLLQLGQSGLFPNSSILQLGQSGLIPGLSGMPNSPLTSWQQQLFADTPRGLPSPRVAPPAQQAQQQQQQQQQPQQQQQQQAGLPPLAPRQAQRSAPQQQAVQQAPPQQQQAVQQLPPQQAQQAEPDAPAEQLLRLLQPSPFDSTATAAQKAVAQVCIGVQTDAAVVCCSGVHCGIIMA